MTRRLVLQAVGTVGISLYIATRLGAAILDPTFFTMMACMSMLFVGPIVVRTRKVYTAVLIAFGLVAFSLALSLAWVGAGIPEIATIAKAAAASLVVTSAIGGLTLLLLSKTRLKPNIVMWIMRGLMLAFYVTYRTWPEYFGV